MQSMFEPQEQRAQQEINTDPREQRQRQEQPSSEEYTGVYEEPWQTQAGGGKIYPQQRKRQGGLGRALVAIAVVLALVIGVGLLNYSRSRPYPVSPRPMMASPQQVFNVGAQPTLIINDQGGGTVHIHTGGAGQVIVQTTNGDDEDGGRSSAPVTSHQIGDTITLNTQGGQGFPFGFGDRSIDITTPDTSSVVLRTGSSDVEIEGVNGQVTVETDSGDVHASNVSGQVTVNTNSGDIEMDGAALKGNDVFKTRSGDISINGSLDPQGSYEFDTDSGSVDLTLPSNSSFSLTSTTTSGRSSNDFGSDTVGSQPRATLTIHTNSGDISLHKGS